MALKIDDTNIKLTELLVKDSSTHLKLLASQLNITLTPLRKRLEKLMIEGYLKPFFLFDVTKFPNCIVFDVTFWLTENNLSSMKEFHENICKFDYLIKCKQASGNYHFAVSFLFKDNAEKEHFILNELPFIPNTSVVTSAVIHKSFIYYKLRKLK